LPKPGVRGGRRPALTGRQKKVTSQKGPVPRREKKRPGGVPNKEREQGKREKKSSFWREGGQFGKERVGGTDKEQRERLSIALKEKERTENVRQKSRGGYNRT